MRTSSEHVDQIASRASLTELARERLAAMVNIDGFPIAAAALEFGVGWHTANAAIADETDPAVDDPVRLVGVRGIGVDAKRFSNATVEHRTVFTTQILDLDQPTRPEPVSFRLTHSAHLNHVAALQSAR